MDKKNNLKSTRDGFGEALLSLAKKNKNIVVVSADLAESTRIADFAKKYPERFIEVGVAEQNMMGVAAGLALSGKVAIASSYAAFSPGRTWDQLRISVCYSKANVKIIGSHTGLGAGEDGASHQALEDIAITRCLPNLVVIAPADYNEAKKALAATIEHRGPVYLRLTRQNSPIFTTEKSPFKIGQANVLRKGQDITLIACGPMVYEALEVAKKLASENISVEVINCHTIKPLDKKTILASAKKTKKVLTLEDHQVHGGLGSAVAEMLAENFPVPMKIMGVQDTFGESGKPDELYKKYGLSQEHIIKNIKEII
ncbi:MAG: Transketolase [Patescibacteria group bacterium]|nr:Transketolase [Patescibacteria group bacterium]